MIKDEALVVDLSQTNLTEKILPRSPLLSSQEAGWNGIHLEYHRQPAHEVLECCFAQHIICIQVGRAGASLTVDGHFQGKYYTDGDIPILPAHQYIPRTRCDGEADFIESAVKPTYEKAWDIRRVSAGTELTNKSFNEATRLDRESYIHVLT